MRDECKVRLSMLEIQIRTYINYTQKFVLSHYLVLISPFLVLTKASFSSY